MSSKAESKEQKRRFAIGIDCGTTFSAVGVVQHGSVHIISNDQGNRTMPSVIAFTDTERLVGEAAKNQSPQNPTNTIFDVKRLIGLKFSDNVVQKDMKSWPFKVVCGPADKPNIRVEYQGKQIDFLPEQLSANVLEKMKEIAEAYLGEKVTDAVITVPARFNDSQRQATKDAARIAGLNPLRILDEPTAAAKAYGESDISKASKGEQNILIYDLGGGTFDVSVLTLEDGVYEVRATTGDTHLGGEDFDNKILGYFVDEFKKKNGKDIRANPRSIMRLKTACERAKRTLSSAHSAEVEIDSLLDGIDFKSTITRAKFEDLCGDYFRGTLGPVEEALTKAKVSKSDVHQVVLVGGCSRIPKIQELLSKFFDGKPLCKSVNPDEAVAYGAALMANDLVNPKESTTLLIDIVSLTLGIQVGKDVMEPMIAKNSKRMTKVSKVFTTAYDNQPAVEINAFEGERALTTDNNKIATFQLQIPPAPAGVPQIKVTFEVDADNILTITALDVASNKEKNIKVTSDSNRLSSEQVKKALEDGIRYKAQDEMMRAQRDARNKLEGLLHMAKKNDTNKENAKNYDMAEKWIADHPNEPVHVYEARIQELTKAMQAMQQSAPTSDNQAPPSSSSGVGVAPTSSSVKVEELD